MHTNHRRRVKARQSYPWDMRGRKVRGYRVFRAAERRCLDLIRVGEDPDGVLWPYRTIENDNAWNYD